MLDLPIVISASRTFFFYIFISLVVVIGVGYPFMIYKLKCFSILIFTYSGHQWPFGMGEVHCI